MQRIKQITRSLMKYKGFTFINLFGLSIGIAATLIIFLLSSYENSFDKFHSENKDIYRVVRKQKKNNEDRYTANTPYPSAKFLRIENPGVIATQLHFFRNINVRIGQEEAFEERNVFFADSLFFKVFDFSGIHNYFIAGNRSNFLDGLNKVVITETTAQKYFGSENPMGKLIRLNNIADLEVTGVVRDQPTTTHLPFSMIVSYPSFTKDFTGGLDPASWSFTASGFTYVRVKDPVVTERAIKYMLGKIKEEERYAKEQWTLQPLAAIHFDPTYEISNASYSVSRKYLRMLLILACFIILVACVNYINLSTSLAFSKSKEVGIRKTIGASKKQLFFHYILETVLVTTVATIIGIIIAVLLLPLINTILNRSISIQQLWDIRFVGGILLGITLISFISGIYPALILAGFNPITALKSRFIMPGKTSALLRKSLVVFQFTTSIALIICTIVIARQMAYVQNKELGFNKESVIEVGLPVPDSTRREHFRTLIQGNPAIVNYSFCLGAPVSDNEFGTSIEAPEIPKDSRHDVQLIPCDLKYQDTYEMKLLVGRWFLSSEEKSLGAAIVVNQAVVRLLGYKNPDEAVGKKITIGINDYSPTIIGVMADFHTTSFQAAIGPVGMLPFPYFYYATAIRLRSGSIKQGLADIELAWKKVYPESAYQMRFVDETLAERYEQEKKQFSIFQAFSFISIFICCIGLWGLIAFVVVRKTKEIGIRKVLGSSVGRIVYLLSRDFLKLVIIAFVVASPIAWYFMNKWLQNFAYRINISWWVFVLAGAAALVIALFTVSFQAIKAAIANPVKSLRTE